VASTLVSGLCAAPRTCTVPPFTCFQIDLVGLYGDLVVGVLNTGTQVVVKDGVPRAQDKRPLANVTGAGVAA